MKVFYTYILQCSDDTYYTGFTSELDKRVAKHEASFYENSYTSERLPVELVYYEIFTNPLDGITREKQLRKWSQAKKKALVEARVEDLPLLSKKKFR